MNEHAGMILILLEFAAIDCDADYVCENPVDGSLYHTSLIQLNSAHIDTRILFGVSHSPSSGRTCCWRHPNFHHP
jgi:hypothetical protein